jgi:hypothetical protein
VLIVDSEMVVPEDCSKDAATSREMRERPTVAIIQHERLVVFSIFLLEELIYFLLQLFLDVTDGTLDAYLSRAHWQVCCFFLSFFSFY